MRLQQQYTASKLGPGDIVGVASMFSGKEIDFTLVADNVVTVYYIPRERLVHWWNRDCVDEDGRRCLDNMYVVHRPFLTIRSFVRFFHSIIFVRLLCFSFPHCADLLTTMVPMHQINPCRRAGTTLCGRRR